MNRILKRIAILNDFKEIDNANFNVNDAEQINTQMILNSQERGNFVLYYNGNFLIDQTQTLIGQYKTTYTTWVNKYYQDEALHTNDIIKKSMDEWKAINNYNREIDFEQIGFYIYKEKILIVKSAKVNDFTTIIRRRYSFPIYMLTETNLQLRRLA